MPNIVIIGGPNGAGKTTSAFSLIPELLQCDEYVNADTIAAGLSPFNVDGAAIEAGKIMVLRIRSLMKKRVSFAFETTLAAKYTLKLTIDAEREGYGIHLLYLWLQSPELAIARVAERVARGGHSVPDEVIRRRYYLGAINFAHFFIAMADSWLCYDNSRNEPLLIATGVKNGETSIYDWNTWRAIREVAE